MYEVQNNNRLMKFDGALLAFSSSYRPGSARWIEFTLYRTTGGSYVLSRVGETRLYHTLDCTVTGRSALVPIPRPALKEGSVPCSICHPDRCDDDEVAPEMPRYWAQVSDGAESVVEGVYRYGDGGERYLTAVAEKLLEEASEVDPDIEAAYRIETIL